MTAFDARTYKAGEACTDGLFKKQSSANHAPISPEHLIEVRRMLFWNRTGILFLWLLYIIMLVLFVMSEPPQKAGEWAELVIMVFMNLLFIQPLHDSIRNTVSSDTVVYPGVITYTYFSTQANSKRCWHADVRLSDGTLIEALELDGLSKNCKKGDSIVLVPLSTVIIVLPETIT